MNEEIKEILDSCRAIFIIDDEGFTVNINDIINNYITNLQEENQKLIKGIQEAISYIKQHCEIVHYENENIDKIGKVEGIPLLNILDKLYELKKEVE